MWKVLIADDEPKIRRGLSSAVHWAELDMEVVAEAEDGEMALELAQHTQPDILLVDICMPFLNGLQFIEKLKAVRKQGLVIVITGHDEFVYAQQAVRLQVFDYLLKPVGREQLKIALKKAVQNLEEACRLERYVSWVSRETKKNVLLLREVFCKEWIAGVLDAAYIAEQLVFLDLPLPPLSGMLMVRMTGRCSKGQSLQEWDRAEFLDRIRCIVEESLAEWQPAVCFSDDADNLVVIAGIKDCMAWCNLGLYLQQSIEQQIKLEVVVCQRGLDDLRASVPAAYQQLVGEVQCKLNYTPAVLLCQRYIEDYYHKPELSLKDLAESIQISPAYLSRLLKQEIGTSFIDYLTHVRMQKAMLLMSDPSVRLYEVSERVGYSNQHYFSTAFKKVVGVSPAEYRKQSMGGELLCRESGL